MLRFVRRFGKPNEVLHFSLHCVLAGARYPGVSMLLAETRDKATLRAHFAADPWRHIYQWGDLVFPLFGQCRWFVAQENGSLSAVLLLFDSVATPVALPTGHAGTVGKLFKHFWRELPDRFYTKLEADHAQLLGELCDLENPMDITVMGLDKFQATPQPPRTTLQLLTPRHALGPLPRIYEHYPGNWFEPSHLENGLYAGAWVQGRLVSVAGTHAFAPAEGLAVLGNIVTHAEYRGRGLCAATVSFLIRELRKARCRHIGLHVESVNVPAIACYERIGFRTRLGVTQYLARKRMQGT